MLKNIRRTQHQPLSLLSNKSIKKSWKVLWNFRSKICGTRERSDWIGEKAPPELPIFDHNSKDIFFSHTTYFLYQPIFLVMIRFYQDTLELVSPVTMDTEFFPNLSLVQQTVIQSMNFMSKFIRNRRWETFHRLTARLKHLSRLSDTMAQMALTYRCKTRDWEEMEADKGRKPGGY